MTSNTSHSAPDPGAVNMDAEVGLRVHTLMFRRKITQTALAPRVGMGQSSIAKKLRGDQKWTVAELRNIADALDTTISYLVGETDDDGDGTKARTKDYGVATSHNVASLDDARQRRQNRAS
jgi:transcriptional regulator with XRE-family HTH domain